MSIYIEQTATIPAWDQDTLISWTGCSVHLNDIYPDCEDELEMNTEILSEELWELSDPQHRPIVIRLRDPRPELGRV